MSKTGKLAGDALLKINSSVSVLIAFISAHKIGHLHGALAKFAAGIAFFDPKLGKYVVCITHNPAYSLGDLID